MKRLFILCLLTVLFKVNIAAQVSYFPPLLGNGWETTDFNTLNWCPEKVNALYNFLEEEESKSFLLIKDGKIVLEKYFGSYTQDSIWVWFSAGKSLRATLVGIAQEEGKLNIGDKTSDYLGTGWTSLSPEKEEIITVRNQLTMTTGLNEIIFDCIEPSCLRYVADAGTRWAYHNSPYNLLKEVLESATGETINAYTNSRIKSKIGMQSGFWISSGNNTFFLSKARDMARFGLLIQNKGVWNNTTLMSDTVYLNQMLNTSQNLNPAYGYLWWLNGKASYIAPDSPVNLQGAIAPDAPVDMYTAAGAQGQFISISPSNKLLLIRQGIYSQADKAPIALLNDIWKKVMELECLPTSVEELTTENIVVYPNPATKWIEFSGVEKTGGEISILIYDLMGKQILKAQNTTRINIENLVKGSYLLKIKSKNAVYTKKFLKS